MKDKLILKDKSKLPREARKTADTVFDRIWKYYYSDKRVELNKKEEEMRLRWENVWRLLGDILITTDIVKTHRDTFPVSEQTAYLDLRNAKLLFGDSNDQMKKAKRAIMSEWLIRAMNKADKNEDYKAFEKLALRYSRINGLDVGEGDNTAEFLKKIKPHVIIISGDTKSLKEEADGLMKDVPEDTDYEVLEDEQHED